MLALAPLFGPEAGFLDYLGEWLFDKWGVALWVLHKEVQMILMKLGLRDTKSNKFTSLTQTDKNVENWKMQILHPNEEPSVRVSGCSVFVPFLCSIITDGRDLKH